MGEWMYDMGCIIHSNQRSNKMFELLNRGVLHLMFLRATKTYSKTYNKESLVKS